MTFRSRLLVAALFIGLVWAAAVHGVTEGKDDAPT